MDRKELKRLANDLGFHAIVANWNDYVEQSWLEPLLKEEEKECQRRSLERRIKEADIGAIQAACRIRLELA